MAIAGSPGIPSCGIYQRNGHIHFQPITQNKPPSCVEQDLAQAARRIRAGETVQVDVRGGNVGRLLLLLEET